MNEYKYLNSRVESESNEVMETETIGKNGMKFKMKRLFLGVAIGFSMVSGFAQTTEKPRLDSMVSSKSEKRILSYDDRENNILDIIYTWDNVNNTWIGYYKYDYAYDNNRNRTRAIYYTWNNTANDWIKNTKSDYTHDNNGNRARDIQYRWNNTVNDWIEMYKTDYTYDNNGNQTRYIQYYWDNTTNDWIVGSKNDYTYDNNGNQTRYIHYNWNNATNDWMENYKYNFTYDENENHTRRIFYRWDNAMNDWMEDSKNDYTYDNNGNQIMGIYYTWDNTANDWIVDSKSDNTFDNKGNRTRTINSTWDNAANDWKGSYKYDYTFNLSYLMTDVIRPSMGFIYMPTKLISYTWSGTDWIENVVTIYYWSGKNVGIVETACAPSLRVYPNPTNGQLRITNYELRENTEIEIFDIVGKRQNAECRKAESEIIIDISHLTAGLYFLKIDNRTVKIIKE